LWNSRYATALLFLVPARRELLSWPHILSHTDFCGNGYSNIWRTVDSVRIQSQHLVTWYLIATFCLFDWKRTACSVCAENFYSAQMSVDPGSVVLYWVHEFILSRLFWFVCLLDYVNIVCYCDCCINLCIWTYWSNKKIMSYVAALYVGGMMMYLNV